MIQTNEEELQAFYAKALPGFLEYIRTHGTDVGSIETVSSLDGINSLPALLDRGGVQKTVLAPLDLLSGGADAAAQQAQQAADSANNATLEAEAAAAKVTTAITDISKEKQAALDAASSANKAADKANTAADNADSKRKEIEANESARQTAEEARVAAEKKRETASEEAVKAASSATVGANNAADSANNAASKANLSATAADSATRTLTTVKTECANSSSAAQSAAQAAEEKIAEMEEMMKSFAGGDGSTSPTRMTLSCPEEISTRNKLTHRIAARLYPTYVGQNVLFQREEGESLRVNPSGVLRVKCTGETVFYVIPTQNTGLWREVTVRVRTPRLRLTSTGKLRLNGSKIRIV